MVNGDAFLTNRKTVFLAKKLLKKLQKSILNFLRLGEHLMLDSLKKLHRLEFGL